jgi:hypothetical protein
VGLTPAQHQLLVAIKGHPGPEPPAIRELADYLLLQSHSAVGLVDRAEAAGFVQRRPELPFGRGLASLPVPSGKKIDERDCQVVQLTAKGDRLVTELTEAHLAELHNLTVALVNLLPGRDGQRREPAPKG